MGPSETTSAEEELKWQIHDLSFSVHKARRYHEKLCQFFGGWRDAMKIGTIIAGSGLFVLVFSKASLLAEILSALIALWASLDLIIAPDKKAELHRDLCRKFTQFAAELETMPYIRESYARFSAEKIRLESLEPPCKRLVDLQARNDECRARRFPPEDLVPLSKMQRIFGYYFTFGMERLEKWKADRETAETFEQKSK